jgi:hypothetical protein
MKLGKLEYSVGAEEGRVDLGRMPAHALAVAEERRGVEVAAGDHGERRASLVLKPGGELWSLSPTRHARAFRG